MKTTLYMATSIDGLITKGQSDFGWVSESDWDQFYSYMQKNEVVVIGRKTMDQFDDDEFPIEGLTNIVPSRNKQIHKETENVIIMEGIPKDVIVKAKELNFKNVLLIGGSDVNSQFLKAGLIDEIVLSVHTLVIEKA